MKTCHEHVRKQNIKYNPTKYKLLSSLLTDTLLELSFNADKDHFRMYQWKRHFDEAIFFNKSKTTRLNEHLMKNFVNSQQEENPLQQQAEKKKLERVQTCLPIMKD